MTVSRDAAGPYGVGRNTLSALCVVGLLTTLGACAAENAAGLATSASAPAAAPAAAPVAAAAPPAAPATPPATAATTTAAAPKPAPQVLTPTEINEQCWMSSEVNKMKDLDAKAKYVDKCVAEKMKAQGM
jgi:type IV secretory pathway VirB10-like protein